MCNYARKECTLEFNNLLKSCLVDGAHRVGRIRDAFDLDAQTSIERRMTAARKVALLSAPGVSPPDACNASAVEELRADESASASVEACTKIKI